MTPALPALLQGGRKRLLLRLLINGLAQSATIVASAWLVKTIFDRVTNTVDPGSTLQLLLYAVGLLGVAAAIAGLRWLESVDAERLGQHYTHDVRVGLFEHLSGMSFRELQRRSRGGVLLRFIGDLTALKQWVSFGIARLIVAGTTVIGALAALSFISGPLALVVGVTLFLGGLVAFILGRWLEDCVREVRRRRSRVAANVNEKIAALAVVQVTGQVEHERQRVARLSSRLREAMVARATAVGALRAVTEATAAIASGSALLLGVILVAAHDATPGTVVAAMSVVGLLVSVLKDLGRVQEYWHGAVVSREKIMNFLAVPATWLQGDKQLAEGPGHLDFVKVEVKDSLKNFSATAMPGTVTAIVGPNGAGKSTLLMLAAGLLNPDKGALFLDGHDLSKVSRNALQRAVGMASPDLPLLRGTLEDNLRYRWPDAPEEEVARVKTLCGIENLFSALPQGGATRLNEGGANLSLGQRQRLCLARAVLGSPRLLLLDEADTHLDPATSEALGRVIAEYSGTVLMIVHSEQWLRLADQVWHVSGGQLIEAGTPAALLNGSGATARLFRRSAYLRAV